MEGGRACRPLRGLGVCHERDHVAVPVDPAERALDGPGREGAQVDHPPDLAVQLARRHAPHHDGLVGRRDVRLARGLRAGLAGASLGLGLYLLVMLV